MVHRQGEKTESVRWLELLDVVLYMFLVTDAGYAFFFLLVR